METAVSSYGAKSQTFYSTNSFKYKLTGAFGMTVIVICLEKVSIL